MTPHHHLVCSACKAIFDVEATAVEPVHLPTSGLPAGFAIQQCRVEFVGVCKSCQKARRMKLKAVS